MQTCVSTLLMLPLALAMVGSQTREVTSQGVVPCCFLQLLLDAGPAAWSVYRHNFCLWVCRMRLQSPQSLKLDCYSVWAVDIAACPDIELLPSDP